MGWNVRDKCDKEGLKIKNLEGTSRFFIHNEENKSFLK